MQSLVFCLLLLLTNYVNIWAENLLFLNAFSNVFHDYDVTTLEIIHPIISQKYRKQPIKVLQNNSNMLFKNM